MSNPILTVLTPSGAGAIGVVSVCGTGAWDVVRRVAERPGGKLLPKSPAIPGFWFAHVLGEIGEAGDEVVISRLPHRDGEWVEVHGHGGRRATRWLVERLTAAGATEVPPHEFPHRHAVADARAWPLLERAPTTRVANIILDQLHKAQLEEDNFAGLTKNRGVGGHLVTPWKVVIAGPPNVGKSSLTNALAGYTRSVVAPIAGTTRDVVRTKLAFGGWPVELADTAGLRDGDEALESLGIARARAALVKADLILWVLDASEIHPIYPTNEDQLPMNCVRFIANKCDLANGDCGEAFRVSARTGEGVPELAAAIANWLVPCPPEPGEAVPFMLDPVLADTIGGLTPS